MVLYCCCAWASSMNLTDSCHYSYVLNSCDVELLYIYIYFWWKLTTAPVKHDGKKSQVRKCDKFMYARPTLAIILVYLKTAWHTLVLEQESGIWGCRLRNKWLLCSQFLTVWPTAAEKARVPNLKMDLSTNVNPLTIYVYHSFCILWCELCLLGQTGTQVHTSPQIASQES